MEEEGNKAEPRSLIGRKTTREFSDAWNYIFQCSEKRKKAGGQEPINFQPLGNPGSKRSRHWKNNFVIHDFVKRLF